MSFDKKFLKLEKVPIVSNMVLMHDNINKIKKYLQKEHAIANQIWKYNKNDPQPNHFQFIHLDVLNLIGTKLESNVLDQIIYQGCNHRSIDLILQMIELLDRLTTNTPQNCAIVFIKYKDIILGITCLIIDSRITIDNQLVVYFTGFLKSSVFLAAKKYKSGLPLFKLTSMIVREVNNYGQIFGAVYLASPTLHKITKILAKHFGFTLSDNIIHSSYQPALYQITVCEERILWKKMQ